MLIGYWITFCFNVSMNMAIRDGFRVPSKEKQNPYGIILLSVCLDDIRERLEYRDINLNCKLVA